MRPVRDDEDFGGREPVSVTSVLMGLSMVAAIIVTGAAWMGGSLSKMESRLANVADATARSVGLGVDHVAIVGLDHDPALFEEVRAAAMIEPGENMFRADPHVIRRRIEATRKVAGVRVHRLWPDQVMILADPAEPTALWSDGRRWAVIDAMGREMPGVDPAGHSSLPRTAGAGAPDAAPALAAALAEWPELAASVHYAERVAGRRWDLHLTSGARVHLPGDARLAGALARLSDLAGGRAFRSAGLAGIDLRHGSRVFLTPAAEAPHGDA